MKKIKKLSQEEVASFCSQLSLLLPAGITPYEAIILIREDTPDVKGKEILEQLEAALKAIIAEVGAEGPKDMGKVMGTATKKLAGLAEGRAISAKVKELLG